MPPSLNDENAAEETSACRLIADCPMSRPHFPGVYREDMKKLLLAIEGKMFSLQILDRLVECSRLRDFQTVQ